MDLAGTIDLFITSIIPHGVSDELATQLRKMGQWQRIAPSESADLLRDSAHYVWIAGGNAKLVAHGSGGQQQVIEFHFPGDLVLVPARQSHDYSLDALTSSDLLTFPAAELLQAAAGSADLALALLKRMNCALAQSRELSVTLGRKRAMERVAGFLLSIRDRVCEADGASALMQLPMSRRDIGENLAITVESISREVGRLRKERLIETPARAKVTILDAKRLADRAGIFAGAA